MGTSFNFISLSFQNVLLGRDRQLLETLQLYTLDLVTDEIAPIALQKMVDRTLYLWRQLSARAKSQKLNGNYACIWFEVENLTLENRFKMLSKIAQNTRIPVKINETIPGN